MIDRATIQHLRDNLIQDTPPWMRSLSFVGLLLFNAALVFLALRRQFTLAVYLLVGVSQILVFLRWPSLGLLVAAVVGMVIPFVGPSGSNITMILVALLLGLWLLDMVVNQHQIRQVASRTTWPLLSFLVVAFFSFGIGQLSWLPFTQHAPMGAQLGGLSIFVLSAGAFLLVANQVKDLGWLRRITWAFLILGGFSVVFRSILPELGLPTKGWFQQMGSVFYIWLVAMAFSQAAFNQDLHPGWRLALSGLVLITLYVLLSLKFADKSGWIPCLVCIIAIIGFRSWRAGLALLFLVAVSAYYLTPVVISSDVYSVSTRLDAWQIIFQIIKINPLVGTGIANYYWYTPLFPIRGYEVSFSSHNNYLDILAQTGLVGFACFLWFLWETGRLGWRLRDKVPSGFARAYVYGALGGLVGMIAVGMFGDWVLPFFYNIGLDGFRSSMLGWLFLGGLVSLKNMKLTA